MTLKTWCKRTGWPYEEFMALQWTEASEILALYGMHFTFKDIPKPPKLKRNK